MKASSPDLRARVVSQIEAIQLIIARLSDSTPGSSSSACPAQKAQNELELLLGALSNIESQSSRNDDHPSPKLWSKLEECHCYLLELQNLQRPTTQDLARFLEIRAQLPELIFELSVINADMAMCVFHPT